jgi:hypothetical protein
MEDFGIFLLGVAAAVMGVYHVVRRRYVALDDIGTVIGTYRAGAVACQGAERNLRRRWRVIPRTRTNALPGCWNRCVARGAALPSLLCASLAALFFGGFMVLGSEEQRRSRGRLVVSVPGRLIGMILIVLSLGGLALGVLDVVAPVQFQRGMERLRAVLRSDIVPPQKR